jgi:hypothetical protein
MLCNFFQKRRGEITVLFNIGNGQGFLDTADSLEKPKDLPSGRSQETEMMMLKNNK